MKLKMSKLMIDTVIFLCSPGPCDCMSGSRMGMGTLDQVTVVKIQGGGVIIEKCGGNILNKK